MKIALNKAVRVLHFAFPIEACTAVFEVERAFIVAGVATRGMYSGPMHLEGLSHSMNMTEIRMMIEEEHADEFIRRLRKAIKPFEGPNTNYGSFARKKRNRRL